MKTRILPAIRPEEREAAVKEAVEMLRAGEAVALPTETVYGLAADATRPEAVVKIFEAKERPRFDPLIVHLPEGLNFQRVVDLPAEDVDLVSRLIKRFWPGPFTMVLPRKSNVPDLVTAGLPTVAVRCSAHPVFTAVIERFGRPLAAPSANRFGQISPTTAAHVLAELHGRIPAIVDGGPTVHGLESTIVAVRDGVMEILRHGPITAEELAEFGEVRAARRLDHPEAPGQLRSHYSPRTPLVLTGEPAGFVIPAGKKVGALLLQPTTEPDRFVATRALTTDGDLREAAANLFRYLRELDAAGLDLIVAEAVPETGLGVAIMDRLRRAAAR